MISDDDILDACLVVVDAIEKEGVPRGVTGKSNRPRVTAVSLSEAGEREFFGLETAEQRAAWLLARIPDGYDHADPMPIHTGGLWVPRTMLVIDDGREMLLTSGD